MKKVLLLSLGLVMGFSAFAQKAVVKQELKKHAIEKVAVGTDVATTESTLLAPQTGKSVVSNRYENFDEMDVMYTTYDLQSNSYVANRMYQNANGNIAAVATFSLAEDAGASDRGTGYNFYDGSEWGDYPEERFDDERTGWPSIAQYGANGEIVVNHGAGLNYYIRETAGEGEWTKGTIPAPTGLQSINGSPTDFEAMTWARVATSGENHDIIHVVAAVQVTGVGTGIFYARSEDAQSWDVDWAPLAEHNDSWNVYTADDYSIATNGDNVAMFFCGGYQSNAVVYKSADNGLTWERLMVWANPYYGKDWETDETSLFDVLYVPAHGSVTIDNEGVVHAVVTVGAIAHDELGTSIGIYSGYTLDGVAYWNSEMGEPFQPVVEGDESTILNLWIPAEEEGYVVHSLDSTYFCGWIPPHPELGFQELTHEKIFWGSTQEGIAGDYMSYFGGCVSAYPAIAVDPAGNLAVAYSSIDLNRSLWNDQYYFRSVFVSYLPKGETQWIIAADPVFEAIQHLYEEGTCVSAVPVSAKENEFVFSYLADNTPGFAFGTAPSQPEISESAMYVFTISSEYIEVGVEEQAAKDVVYNVYPNPATDYIFVSSKMDADATVTFTNIAGQTVKVVNQALLAGNNSINISELESGVYFCTVTANGFSHTSKVVVK